MLLADIVLLVSAYFVLKDLQWRGSYASQQGFTPSYFYSLLTQFFSVTGRGLVLQSPPTLDWVQLTAVVLVVLNVWYLYGIMTRRMTRKTPQATRETIA